MALYQKWSFRQVWLYMWKVKKGITELTGQVKTHRILRESNSTKVFMKWIFLHSFLQSMKFIVSYHTDTKRRWHRVHNVSSLGTIRWWELKISADHEVNLCHGNKSYYSQISLKPTIQSTLQNDTNKWIRPAEWNKWKIHCQVTVRLYCNNNNN